MFDKVMKEGMPYTGRPRVIFNLLPEAPPRLYSIVSPSHPITHSSQVEMQIDDHTLV